MRIDPYKTKPQYEKWKRDGAIIDSVSNHNAELIRRFLFDLETGTNINLSNKKGARSYARLLSYRSKLKVLFIPLEKEFKRLKIEETKKEELNKTCKDLREGNIKRQDGKIYLDCGDYIKSFKAFWHWLMKVSKKKIEDITLESDISRDKPKWVYLDEKQFKKLAESCKPFYKIIAYFELDFGLRSTEFINTRVSDFQDDFQILQVRDEVSKTYGRKIKTMICKDLIKDYISENKLKGDDLLFNLSLSKINEYFKRKAKSLFGEIKSKAGEKYSNFTLGDIRHISACYWLPRYTTQQGMMYRFGWKKSDKIFYYSEFLSMNDNIKSEDMLIDVTKTELQQEVEKLKSKLLLSNENSEKEIEELKKENQENKKGYEDLQTDVRNVLLEMKKKYGFKVTKITNEGKSADRKIND